MEKFIVPAHPGLDPVIVFFDDVPEGGGRIVLICYDMAWTAYYSSPGSKGIKDFFIDCGADYLSGNFGSGRQYKQDKQSQAYLLRIIKAAQDYLKELDAAPMVAEDFKFPATRIVHCPSGPVACCDNHAAQVTGLMNFMGAHVAHTAAAPDDECTNCRNDHENLFKEPSNIVVVGSDEVNLSDTAEAALAILKEVQ